jgi:hypothetical protein
MKAMPIRNTGKLITDCWLLAEQSLREVVNKKFRDRDEEIITELFRAELETEFATASEKGNVERAFLEDLKQAFQHVRTHELQSKIARGLIATVSFHNRKTEERTGGDLGIVLVRPDVQESYAWSELAIKSDYKRGLLCQAKVFRRNSRWGGLSPAQQKGLSKKLNYFALLLYRYADQKGDRRDLGPFGWQLAAGGSVAQIKQWLSSDKFPNLQDSQRILGALARDQIGTDDTAVIDKDITPPQRPSLVINVRWKDDSPGDSVHVQSLSTTSEQEKVTQYQ